MCGQCFVNVVNIRCKSVKFSAVINQAFVKLVGLHKSIHLIHIFEIVHNLVK